MTFEKIDVDGTPDSFTYICASDFKIEDLLIAILEINDSLRANEGVDVLYYMDKNDMSYELIKHIITTKKLNS